MHIHRLTATRLQQLKKPGRYADGNGLWFQVKARQRKGEPTRDISRSWLYRYVDGGKARHMGLGPYPAVSLAEARDFAMAAFKARLGGVDPLGRRRKEKSDKLLAAAKTMTFEACAKAYIASHEKSWRNAKHAAQWPATLKTYAYPKIGALPVAEVDTGLVVSCVEPIWGTKHETASRVRQRIEIVLSWAIARGHRSGPNPAQWKGRLDQLLPKPDKVRKVEHLSALPYAEIGEFMVALRQRAAVAARSLEFTILTAARTGEVIGARWDEFDLVAKAWTIPASRMKGNREHRVPLSEAALDVLNRTPKTHKELVWPVSNMAMLMMLRRMKRADLTVHGFRSCFRDWTAETTAYPRDVAEMALAHAIEDKTEAAYRRGDLYEKRVRLMRDWGRYCASPAKAGTVTPMRRSAAP